MLDIETITRHRVLEPTTFCGMALRNRLAVAPMTRISAHGDGRASGRMRNYYGAFADGGFGLVVTEGTYTDKAYAQGYLNQPGLADAAQADAWRDIVERVHDAGGRIIAQLMHAGALSQGNPYRAAAAGPSARRPKGEQMTFYRGSGPYRLPKSMSLAEIDEAIDGFVASARRAREAGFDGVEIHGANGYLLDQFLSEGVNERFDDYGGDLERRLKLITRTLGAVRAEVGKDYLVGIRLSQGKVNDFGHKWRAGETAAALVFGRVAEAGADFIHTTEFEAWRGAIAEDGPSLASLAKRHSGLPVIANGSLHDIWRAEGMIGQGEADLVSLGRGGLTHSDFPARLAGGLEIEQFDRNILSPLANLDNQDRVRREAQSARHAG